MMNWWYKVIYVIMVECSVATPITVGTCLREIGGDLTVQVTALHLTTFEVRLVQSVSNNGKAVYGLAENKWNYGSDLKYMKVCKCLPREIHAEMDRGRSNIPPDSIFLGTPVKP